MPRSLAVILRPVVLAAATLALCCPTARAGGFAEVTQPITDYLAANPDIPGAGLKVVRHGRVIHEQYWGTYDAQTRLPIASATKWLSGVVILSLVDDGLIDLDAPVSDYLPELFPVADPRSAMTVRQMFSHTAGAPTDSVFLNAKQITLAQSVALIATQQEWIADPGAEFNYGGPSMQIAGRVAEVVSGRDWETLFDERVAQPLGLAQTDYQGLAATNNPRVAGGAQSSIADYERVLAMLLSGGVYDGTRVLSEAAVAEMLTDQTTGAALGYVPPALEEFYGYGVGNWVELLDPDDGRPLEFSSPGAFGTNPWLNPEAGVYGVFVIDDVNANVYPLIEDVRAFSRTFAPPIPEPGAVGAAVLPALLLGKTRQNASR